jgi:hypothetical protein
MINMKGICASGGEKKINGRSQWKCYTLNEL